MPGSKQISMPAATVPSPFLQPAARGALLCDCRGEVVEMHAQYGWLQVYGDVDHPLAQNRGGHIFVNNQDIVNSQPLVPGDIVTFYLYVDGKGLGAEVCAKECVSRGMYYAPFAFFMGGVSTNVTQECVKVPALPTYTDAAPQGTFGSAGTAHVPFDTELPSSGSAGHFDGSCKRCAFFPKGRCLNGEDCDHCHFDHSKMPRMRRQNRRKERMLRNETPEPFVRNAGFSEEPLKLDSEIEELGTAAISCSSDSIDMQSDCASTEAPGSPTFKDQDSMDDMPDAATRAPSASSYSDDEDDTPVGLRRRLFSEASDAESAGCNASMHLGQDSADLDLDNSRPVAHSTSESFAPSPTSWSAQMRMRRAGALGVSKEVSIAEIARMARALLNKLTHERFESLCGQILELPLSTPEQLAALAAEIFEKATTQDGFRLLYTELCMRLDAHLAAKESAIGGKAFRKALVNECQATFEGYLQPVDRDQFVGLTSDECFEVEMKLKTRRLGNMRFIGELLTRRLLAQKLLPPIVHELLDGDEAALESLIALLTIVAPVLEQKASLYQAHLLDTFKMLRPKRTDKHVSLRVRCHLSDLFDARARGWVSSSA